MGGTQWLGLCVFDGRRRDRPGSQGRRHRPATYRLTNVAEIKVMKESFFLLEKLLILEELVLGISSFYSFSYFQGSIQRCHNVAGGSNLPRKKRNHLHLRHRESDLEKKRNQNQQAMRMRSSFLW
ncbi:unnamed protein product [Musa acuminata subsp. malaccensis]|uniref:(wild Malaysian banana) hypothetical protein n=1 Tax=Musa acuminata subsp. malaccensis TaxID=214687 RepID=A0A804J653_MUSAM|nr:unnamed protein product [Musa acuminata subsp. malaccensis]